MALIRDGRSLLPILQSVLSKRYIHVSATLERTQAGRYRRTARGDKPLTYEMANPPHYIHHRKAWNSWNTSNIKDGNRPSETAVEDVFIRRFMTGTWHGLFLSEIIIKRQHNMIRIAGIIARNLKPSKVYFLIGYTEELLSYWLHCPVKVELATTAQRADVVYKYI